MFLLDDFEQETAPADAWALEKAHLVAEIKSRDAEIQRWTLLAERCGQIFGLEDG